LFLLTAVLLIWAVAVSGQLGVYSFTGTGACPNQNPALPHSLLMLFSVIFLLLMQHAVHQRINLSLRRGMKMER
jgi:hypothetical protein